MGRTIYDALGVFGSILQKQLGASRPTFLKLVPLSPNASCQSEKVAKLAQKSGQLPPFVAA
jgi:hypothetical protein